MIKTSMLSAAITAAMLTSSAGLAQAPQQPQPGAANAPMGNPMMQPGMNRQRFTPPTPPARLPMPEFPTPEELSEMAPPEPLTEEKIKERFAKRKAKMTEILNRDRKAAEKYAQDYARLQKHQADSLADIMAKAEKRREAILQRIDQMEQKVLERFKQNQAAEKQEAAAK